MLNKSVTSTISALLFLCCPAYVPRFIVPVCIYAVQAMAFAWPTANVGEKVLISMPALPAITYANSTSAVPSVGMAFRVTTSSQNAAPDRVLARLYIAVSKPHISQGIFSATTTTPCLSAGEGPSGNRGNIPALTPAFPLSIAVACPPILLDDSEIVEFPVC